MNTSVEPRGGPRPGAARNTATDAIASVTLSRVDLPLSTPISDAKVLTGRQKPLTSVSVLFAEITTEQGLEGVGFT